MAELGTERARVALLVGHDAQSLKPELIEQSSYRFGLVTTQLQQ